MSASFLVIKSNFKNNFVQNLLIGMIIAVCAAIMITGVATFGEMFSAFNTMYEQQEVSDIIVQLNNDDYDVNELHEWWKSQAEVSTVSEIIPCTDFRNITVAGEVLSSYSDSVYFAVKYGGEKSDHLTFLNGVKQEIPEDNMVWVCSSYANSHNLAVGDIIKVPVDNIDYQLQISAIIIDPYYNSGFIQPVRMWINEATYGNIKGAVEKSIIAVKLKNSDDVDLVWKNFSEYFGRLFSGTMLSIATIRFSYLIMSGIIGSVMLLFSILILIITLYVVSSTLSTLIISDYKIIGIFKSMGFTPKQIKNIYLFSYGSISIISVALGSILSFFTSKLMMETFGSSIGFEKYNIFMVIPYIMGAFIILAGMSLFVINRSATKAGKVSTIQAIKFGAQSRSVNNTRKIPLWLYRAGSVSFIYAIKQTITNMRQTIFLLISFIITIFVIVFSVNVYTSIIDMGDNMSVWGYDQSDIYVKLNDEITEREKILREVLGDTRVKHSVAIDEYVPGSLGATDDLASSVIMGTIYDGDMNNIGLQNINGRNPSNAQEISIGVGTANKYAVEIGDNFEVSIYGKTLLFNVSGIYQTVADMGTGYRLTKTALERSPATFAADQYAVMFYDKNDKNEFIHEHESKYKSQLEIGDAIDMVAGNMSSIISYVSLGVFIMSAMFLIILIIILINTITLYINRERNNYGIMKVCGMTPRQLRFVVVQQVWMIFLVSAFVGIPFAVWGTPEIMNLFMSNMGIIQYPITVNILLTPIAVFLVFIAMTVCAWLPSRKVVNISSRELIVE